MNSTLQAAVDSQVRWLIRRDMPEVLDIERAVFEVPWTEDEFLGVLSQRACIGMVAEHQERVAGFMIYERGYKKSDRTPGALELLNFAVAPWYRRCGVGTALIDKLKRKLAQQRREEIVLNVRESNLAAQLFFQRQGFVAIDVLRDHYSEWLDVAEDAYRMSYLLCEQ